MSYGHGFPNNIGIAHQVEHHKWSSQAVLKKYSSCHPFTTPPASRYYKDWIIDNDITFGAINSKHGVIEFVTQGDNPVGIAAPALAVRGGSMLITYSYSGPYSIPLSNGGIRAFPGGSRLNFEILLKTFVSIWFNQCSEHSPAVEMFTCSNLPPDEKPGHYIQPCG